MSMYDTFGTDTSLEIEGVWTNYGDFRVKLAHAGGANKKYLTMGETLMKPHRRAIDTGNFPRERMEAILFQLYTATIIMGWEVNTAEPGEEEVWQEGIESPEGGIMPFNSKNVIQTLRALPALFYDFKEVADSIAAYRTTVLEDEAKNS